MSAQIERQYTCPECRRVHYWRAPLEVLLARCPYCKRGLCVGYVVCPREAAKVMDAILGPVLTERVGFEPTDL